MEPRAQVDDRRQEHYSTTTAVTLASKFHACCGVIRSSSNGPQSIVNPLVAQLCLLPLLHREASGCLCALFRLLSKLSFLSLILTYLFY